MFLITRRYVCFPMFSPICVRVYSNTNQWRSDCALVPFAGLAVFLHIGAIDLIPQKFGASNLQGVSAAPTHTWQEVIRLPIFRTNYYPVPSAARLCEILYWMFHSGRQMVLSVVNIPTLCGVASGSRTSGSLQTNYRAYSFFTAVQMVFSANDRMSWRL